MAVKKVTVDGVDYPVAPAEMPRSDTHESAWLAISPAVAAKWLKGNRSNRNLRANSMASQATDMGSGEWDINGETIKLSRPLKEGEVEDVPAGSILFLDGQHRFEACIESGVPFISLVAYGLSPKVRRSVDTGVARSMGDVLKMEGENLSPVLASTLRRVFLWDRGDRRFMGSRKPTHAELLKIFTSDPQGFRNAASKGYWVRTEYKDLSPSIVATAYYILARVSPEQAPWFFASLKTGADLSKNHPLLTLRSRLGRERAEKKSAIPYHQLAMIIRAWNAYRDDEPLMRMDQSINDPTPDPK